MCVGINFYLLGGQKKLQGYGDDIWPIEVTSNTKSVQAICLKLEGTQFQMKRSLQQGVWISS